MKSAMSKANPRLEGERSKLPLRIAVIGCGAIAEQFHLPVLSGHEDILLAALVDRDPDRRTRLAEAYQVPIAVADQSELGTEQIDAAILATPPSHHAPGSIELLEKGIHVLVEKPMALDAEQAKAMCRAAEASGAVLAVGVYKRLLPAVQFMKRLLSDQQFGRPLKCTANWGGIGAYGSATLALMKKELAGGGVLMDLGPHLLDILVDWFGSNATVIEYLDDSRGGIEADCDGKLKFETEHGTVDVDFHLSRVRNLESGFRVECESATLELGVTERFEVRVLPNDGSPAYMMRPATADVNASWFEPYRAEVDDWFEAIVKSKHPQLSGQSCLPSMRLIEECYSKRRPLEFPWLIATCNRVSYQDNTKPVEHKDATSGTVLITGAGGFIGTRTAELLFAGGRWNVRGQVRRPSSASRLARLPIEMVQADLKSDADIARIVDGCDAIVHCAVGTDYGQNRSIYDVTVGGTKRLVDAARQAGVKRFVHISSIGVHDPNAHQVIDAQTPLHMDKKDWYGYTKGLAEEYVRKSSSDDFVPVILRPGCVYGPYGFTFVMNPLSALADGRLVLAGASETPSNTVFVDNLVEAIRLALESDPDQVRGGVAAVGDPDAWTWGEYYGYFADALGSQIRITEAPDQSGVNRPRGPNGRALSQALTSTESKEFAKRLLMTDPVGTIPRWTFSRFPKSEDWVRRRLKMDAPEIYERATKASGGEVTVTPRIGAISNSSAERLLRYKGSISREISMSQTLQWAIYAGIAKANAIE